MNPDRELLRHYAERHDEAAFAEVVRRHADLVYSVALRKARDAALAQDITQSVFTKLARHAAALSRYETIVGWLHTATRHTAINAIRGEERRRVREQEAFTMQNNSAGAEVNWTAVGPLLDDAVGQLREADRQAVLLRFFNGLSHQEVGAVLGLSEDTARKRIDRALEKLRGYFARRGVTVSSTLLATAMAENSVQAAPAGLATHVAGVSLAGASSATLGSAFLMATFMSAKTKTVVAAVVILALLATIVIKLQSSNQPPAGGDLSQKPSPGATTPHTQPMQVEKPALAPATPSKQSLPTMPVATAPIPADATNAAPQFVAGPKPDLPTAVATGMHFLDNQDVLGFFRTLMPPGAMEGEGKGSTLEDFVAQISEDPRTAQKLANMLAALNALEFLSPNMNDDKTRATYTLNPPVGGHKVVIFNKVDGAWYLDGM